MPHRLALPLPLLIAAVTVSLTACGDDPIRPDDLARFAEAEAVMRSAAALPSLGELVGRAPPTDPAQRATLTRAQELWAEGAASARPRGLAERRLAAAYAAPLLTELVPPGEWPAVRERVDDWMATAEQMVRHLVLPPVEERLAAARGHLTRADAATTEGTRVYHLLLAMAELVETTPRFVARRLVEDAARAVARAEARLEGGSADDMLERARRLADWAARAVDEDDHVRAIQRAYYAIQLVENR